MERGNKTVRDALKGCFIPDVDLPGVGHGNSIQSTPALHAQRTGMEHLGYKIMGWNRVWLEWNNGDGIVALGRE